MREVIIEGLSQIFNLIDSTLELDFEDFEAEKLEEIEEPKKEEPKKESFIKKIFK